MNLGKVTLKPAKDKSIKRFHPWIFSTAVKEIERATQSCQNRFLFTPLRLLLPRGRSDKGRSRSGKAPQKHEVETKGQSSEKKRRRRRRRRRRRAKKCGDWPAAAASAGTAPPIPVAA